MKSKTKTYLLLATVLAVWGIIGFKIFSTLNPDTPEVIAQNKIVVFNPKTKVDVHTFSIQNTNRDPFLGTLYTKNTSKKPKAIKPKETLVWVPITFHGSIAKQQSKVQVFVISINGKQQLMKVGQEINDVKLVSANTKEIIVAYKGEKKTITKS